MRQLRVFNKLILVWYIHYINAYYFHWLISPLYDWSKYNLKETNILFSVLYTSFIFYYYIILVILHKSHAVYGPALIVGHPIYSQAPWLRLSKRVTRRKLQCEICAFPRLRCPRHRWWKVIFCWECTRTRIRPRHRPAGTAARGQIATADRRTGSQLRPAAERRTDENWERICEHSGRTQVETQVGCTDILIPIRTRGSRAGPFESNTRKLVFWN